MPEPVIKSFNYEIRCFKIHIRDPHRNDIIPSEDLLPEVVLDRISSLPVDNLIEFPVHQTTFEIRAEDMQK